MLVFGGVHHNQMHWIWGSFVSGFITSKSSAQEQLPGIPSLLSMSHPGCLVGILMSWFMKESLFDWGLLFIPEKYPKQLGALFFIAHLCKPSKLTAGTQSHGGLVQMFFSFQKTVIFRFQPLVFRGCT